jgi:hypothetical protein
MAIRTAWIAGYSTKQLSEKYNVSTRHIERRRAKDREEGKPWERAIDYDPRHPDAPCGLGKNVLAFPGSMTQADERRAKHEAEVRAREGHELTLKSIEEEFGICFDDPRFVNVTPQDALELHGTLSVKLMFMAHALVQDFVKGNIQPAPNQSKADVAEKIGSFVTKAITSNREIAGIKPGVPSAVDLSPNESTLEIIEQVLEPKVITIDQEGRHIA